MAEESSLAPLLIVGIGASAGGLDALKELFRAMPVDTGIAFVVIQHLDPSHESRMVEILSRCTDLQVVEAEDGAPVRANTIYLNPAASYVTIGDGRLMLRERTEQDRVRLPIDMFLTSLAENSDSASASIILSGSSGSDGTKGSQAIHTAGGLTLAQQPDAAQFPAMPQSAIDSGFVDQVLPVSSMPDALIAYASQISEASAEADGSVAGSASVCVDAILKLLLVGAASDYRHYKRATVIRRISRRMAIRRSPSFEAYCKLLEGDQTELTRLAHDMLIGVSAFFRDAPAFQELREQVLIPLAADQNRSDPIRAWVPGCSTGEEAYTIAMLLFDALAAAGSPVRVQVFASDIDERALETARTGVYSADAAAVIPPALLAKYFTKQGEQYRVEKKLREAVVFSRQDLIADPPFSKLDLISCRNVLIYIQPPMQQKVLSLFSFALNRGGCLFLGKSEGIGELREVFEPISKQNRIFRLVRPGRRSIAGFSLQPGGRALQGPDRSATASPAALALVQANQSVLLRHFRASVVLVNARGQILHFYGDTERYLGHPKGLASLNVLDMIAGSLSARLRRAMEQVLADDETVLIPRVVLPRGESTVVNISVMKVPSIDQSQGLLAIIFEDVHEPAGSAPAAGESIAEVPLLAHLEEEVKTLRNELRSEAEGFESANEELKAANEEVMSMNEELQSANEELEASKEELQSLNEELSSVNSQLNDRLGELASSNNDLSNLLTATEIATVFLDSQLRIKRFTPRATELLNVIPADIGRPISHITQNFDGRQLAAESEKILRTLASIEREVQTGDGRWHMMRILPYRTLDDRIDGVVITFSDVTRLKQAEADRRELEQRMLQAQKLESLGVLAGGIAHDFNNILTALLGSTELALLDLPDGTAARGHIQTARQCAWRASELTAQMLAYSGRGTFNFRRVDINTVIREMEPLLTASVSKNAKVEYRLTTPLPGITADPTQIAQVVLNLVINASEAMTDGAGIIEVTTEATRVKSGQTPGISVADTVPDAVPDGEYVLLTVVDNGCGMDAATKARVFEPFFSTKFTGRGLGLSVVAGIVRGHRGAILVESSPGNGSSFRVLLPIDSSRTPAPAPKPAAVRAVVEGKGTILIIDDETSVRSVVAAFLERSGYQTLSASSAESGVVMLRDHATQVKAVLLDATMPGMSTDHAIIELLAIRADLVIVLCSGFSEAEIATRYLGKGVAGFIPKPFNMSQLVGGLERAVRESR